MYILTYLPNNWTWPAIAKWSRPWIVIWQTKVWSPLRRESLLSSVMSSMSRQSCQEHDQANLAPVLLKSFHVTSGLTQNPWIGHARYWRTCCCYQIQSQQVLIVYHFVVSGDVGSWSAGVGDSWQYTRMAATAAAARTGTSWLRVGSGSEQTGHVVRHLVHCYMSAFLVSFNMLSDVTVLPASSELRRTLSALAAKVSRSAVDQISWQYSELYLFSLAVMHCS